MYYLKKRMEIAGSHQLRLSYPSKCANLHGHNWIITVFCKAEDLDENGMVVDFSKIKEVVNRLDHQHLNNVMEADGLENPTAEEIARWVLEQVPHCYKVTVQESEGNEASYAIL